MIIVEKINWIDKDSGEADVLLSDGVFTINCFCSDCNLLEGNKFLGNLYGFNIENIFKIDKETYKIQRKYDSYFIKGKLIDAENGILQIGELKIDLTDGHIPKDIVENDYLEVCISRIDIY